MIQCYVKFTETNVINVLFENLTLVTGTIITDNPVTFCQMGTLTEIVKNMKFIVKNKKTLSLGRIGNIMDLNPKKRQEDLPISIRKRERDRFVRLGITG